MRPFDADALKYEMVTDLASTMRMQEMHKGDMAVRALNKIDEAPTIEAEPVRHGRWVHDDLGHTYCSECHERIHYIHCYIDEPDFDWDEEWDEEMPESAYCSHCGAKMDAKEDSACD